MTEHDRKVTAILTLKPVIHTRDLAAIGVPRVILTRMVRDGRLIRLARGLYCSPTRPKSEINSIVELFTLCPNFVLCLQSALHFHGLASPIPQETWVAVLRSAHVPKYELANIRVTRFSKESLSEGIETHTIQGASLRVTNIAKTITDSFKFRNKIGPEVALNALREAWMSERVCIEDLWYYAKICRVQNIMKPYLESIAY